MLDRCSGVNVLLRESVGRARISDLGIMEGGAQAEISQFFPKKDVSCGKERVESCANFEPMTSVHKNAL